MATQTRYLKLIKPTTSDSFSTADIAANWEALDASPGVTVCTSTSRPNLTATQAGRHIYETDTDLLWAWTGTRWSRAAPKGLLTTTSGGKAIGVRSSDFQTTSTTPTLVVGVNNVVVPPGNRTIEVTVQWSRAYARPEGYFYGRLYRSRTSNSGPILNQWAISGTHGREADYATYGSGGGYSAYIRDGLPAGTYDFSFQVHARTGSTATVTGTPSYPNEIVVHEV